AGGAKAHHTIDRATKFKMETGPEPSNALAEPLTLATPPMPILEKKRYRVRGVRRPRPTAQATNEAAGFPLKELTVHPNPTESEESVTAASVGVEGMMRGVEFLPLPAVPITLEPEDGLAGFCEAIQVLQAENPEVVLTWQAREIPTGSAFGSVNGRSRKYVVVTLVRKGGSRCCLLEIGRPDDFSISTLLFAEAPPMVSANPEMVIAGLVNEGLHAQGGWNRAEVEALEQRSGIKIGWVRHYDHPSSQWAQRLWRKVLELFL
ncbi:MAG TPA: hypothetical protein PLL06_17870, partial [Acidobacteriota bacterium]|nr:hypothetical protein [Acidobacteriota bacterium]